MREAFKQIIESGGSIKFPIKLKISDWYGSITLSPICSFWDKGAPLTYHIDYYGETYTNIDEAIDSFIKKTLTSNNKGYIQKRLMLKGINFESDNYDLENPSKEVKKLFKEEGKLVDKEFKEKFGDL